MAHPLAKYLYGCWLLNENGGIRALDLSPYKAHGALTGFGDPPRRGFNGLQFTAATPSYIIVPAAYTHLDFTSEDFSLVARIKIDDLSGNRHIIIRGAGSEDGWDCFVYAAGNIAIRTNQAAAFQISISDNGDIVVDEWYTCGFSRAGASAIPYRNGEDVASDVGNHTDPLTSTHDTIIGAYNGMASNLFDGKMEYLYVFGKKALSALDHRAIHTSPYAPYGTPLFI